MLLEIACFNPQSCLIAQEAGAGRIEFCADQPGGGITPSRNDITEVRKKIHIPLFVMIRPRPGDFIYMRTEQAQMKADLIFCKENKVDGIVFGAITKGNTVDIPFCRELVQLALPMSVTFHRAIDQCTDLSAAVKTLAETGVQRVLSSGGKRTAVKGKEQIAALQKKHGNNIIIMPGGSVRSENISELIKSTGCTEFHSSALLNDALYADPAEIKLLRELLQAV
jgi:copper homeostasis protein